MRMHDHGSTHLAKQRSITPIICIGGGFVHCDLV
jgi:hypothetical protein